MPEIPDGPHPGDGVVPEAVMVYDHARLVRATAPETFPWILQVGKGRAGWYTPARLERVLPRNWHASRTIDPAWQQLKPGDRVDDYGFSSDDHFIVCEVVPNRALVYRSERYGAQFSWSLILHEMGEENAQATTLVHLRFRGKISATGWKRRFIVWGGGIMDRFTTAPMLAGLAERVEKSK